MKPLVIKGLDFMRKQNEEKHQTDVYDPEETRSFMVNGICEPQNLEPCLII